VTTRSYLSIFLLAIVSPWCAIDAYADEPGPPGKDLLVYHIGNSLTRNVPLERLQKLFESVGGSYEYGMQLGGGMRLSQHLVKRSHAGPPGSGRYNTIQPYGEYDHALKKYEFDALVLQPYLEELDAPIVTSGRWPFFKSGALQAASAFIDYARGRTEPGDDRWDRQHANDNHVATERFYIYATWPRVESILEQEGEKTYAAYWNAPYAGGVRTCRGFFHKLVQRLNERHDDLEIPIRMIPAGEVLCQLDEKIRNGQLPGIEPFFERNQSYYIKARGPKAPYNPDHFQREAGVLNFYADGVHMNDQPHNGRDSGTIGSYCAALTIFATLTGQSPVGLIVEPYEMFDRQADAQLIRALQQTVWDVVTGDPLTGVKPR